VKGNIDFVWWICNIFWGLTVEVCACMHMHVCMHLGLFVRSWNIWSHCFIKHSFALHIVVFWLSYHITTWQHNPENHNLNLDCHENLRSCKAFPLLLFVLLDIITNNRQIEYLLCCMLDIVSVLLCLALGETAWCL